MQPGAPGARTSLTPAADLTCVQASKNEVDARSSSRPVCATSWRLRAISRPVDRQRYSPHPGGYANAVIWWGAQADRRHGSVGGRLSGNNRPGSRASKTATTSSDGRRGSARIITRLLGQRPTTCAFWSGACARHLGADVPGIVPIHNFKQVAGFAGRCGATCHRGGAAFSTGSTPTRRRRTWWLRQLPPSQVMDWRPGHSPIPLLHADRADLVICHLPPSWAETRAGGSQGGRQRMTREQRIAALEAAAQNAS